jgi:hypothetical protein
MVIAVCGMYGLPANQTRIKQCLLCSRIETPDYAGLTKRRSNGRREASAGQFQKTPLGRCDPCLIIAIKDMPGIV